MFVACESCGGLIDADVTTCPHCGAGKGDVPQDGGYWQDRLASGQQHYDAKRFDQALIDFSQALVEAPESALPDCYVARADTYLVLGDHQRSLDDCTQALLADPVHLEALSLRATAQSALGRWRDAIDDYSEVLRLSPDITDEYRQFVESLVGEALNDFNNQVQRGEADAQLFQDRAAALILVSRHEEAVRDLSTALTADPQNPQSLLMRAQSQAAVGRHTQSVEDATGALAAGHRTSETFNTRGTALLQLGRYAEAISDFNAATQIEPTLVAAHFQRGQAQEALGDVASAIESYTRGLTTNPQSRECLTYRGRLYSEHGNPAAAIDDFGHALKVDPHDTDSLRRRAECYLAVGRADAALQDYDTMLAQDPTSAVAFQGRGDCYLHRGERQQAVDELTKALRLDVRLASAYFSRGRAYLELGKLDLAEQDLTTALDQAEPGEDHGWSYYQRGLARLGQRRFAVALEDFQLAHELVAADAELYLRRAEAAAGLGQWQQAISDLDQAMQLDPDGAPDLQPLRHTYHNNAIAVLTQQIETGSQNATLYRQRGLSRQAVGSNSKALDDFRCALQLDPGDRQALVGAGELFALRGAHDDAMAHYARALEIDDSDARVYFLRGRLLSAGQQHQEAVKDFSRAVRRDPDNVDFRIERAGLLIKHRMLKEAAADLQHILPLAPNRPDVLIINGQLLEAQKHIDDAIRSYDAAIARAPDCARAYYHRGEASRTNRDFDAAIKDFEKAIELDPKLVPAYCSRGLTLAQQRRYDQALIELSKAAGGVRINRGFAAAYESRAEIYQLIGHYEPAIADLTAVIDLKPKDYRFDRTLWRRGLLYIQLEEYEKAEQDFELALELNPRSTAARKYLDWLRGDREQRLAELREPMVAVSLNIPPVVMQEFACESDPRWEAAPLWDQWILCDSARQEYGPVNKQTLDTWFAEGRLNFGSHLLRIDQKKWLHAGEVYPALAPRKQGRDDQLEAPAITAPLPDAPPLPDAAPSFDFNQTAAEAAGPETFPSAGEASSSDDDELPDIRT